MRIQAKKNHFKTLKSGHQQKYMGKKNGKEIWKYVHRLKVGAKDGQVVHHSDGNPSNNNADNLTAMSKARHNVVDKKHHLGGRKKGG